MQYFELSFWTLTGLMIGSFVNVSIDRLSLQFSKTETRLNLLKTYEIPTFLKKHLQNHSLTLFSPIRSFCFTCGKQIKWYENIPVLSYFLCRGICRKCKAPIGSKTILTEITHGVFYLFSGFYLDNWVYTLAISISFSFFWFFGNLCYFLRNIEKIILR